jgi:hypothetical protein
MSIVIEVQDCGGRWAWAATEPESDPTRPPSCSYITGWGAGHPFLAVGVMIDGRAHRRLERGWARTEKRARKKACREVERIKRLRAAHAASEATHKVIPC